MNFLKDGYSSNSLVFEQGTICYISHISTENLLFMTLKNKDLEQIAYLARININKKSFPSLKKELESILELVAKMDSVNTESVVPMSHPLDISQPLRKDEVTEKDDRKNLQKNAPLKKAGLFMVPKVIDEDA